MNDSRTLYLLLTITFLAFISSLYLPVDENYSVALFTTISLPVVYSARYFSKTAVGEEELQFFRIVSKREEIIKDIVAVSTAFAIGYLVYVATSRDMTMSGLYLYAVAFLVALFLRYVIAVWYKVGVNIVDVDHPFVILVVSLSFAILGFALEWLIFMVGLI